MAGVQDVEKGRCTASEIFRDNARKTAEAHNIPYKFESLQGLEQGLKGIIEHAAQVNDPFAIRVFFESLDLKDSRYLRSKIDDTPRSRTRAQVISMQVWEEADERWQTLVGKEPAPFKKERAKRHGVIYQRLPAEPSLRPSGRFGRRTVDIFEADEIADFYAAGYDPFYLALWKGISRRNARNIAKENQPKTNADLVRRIQARATTDERILAAFRLIDRAWFIPEAKQENPYRNKVIPLGIDQSLSQPLLVAQMIDVLAFKQEKGPGKIFRNVLDVGSGTGYTTAILAQLADRVIGVEIDYELGMQSRQTLAEQGITNADIVVGNGRLGLPGTAPFDAILVNAASESAPPEALIDQLAVGGNLVIPLGKGDYQRLYLFRKDVDEQGSVSITMYTFFEVSFVPLKEDI